METILFIILVLLFVVAGCSYGDGKNKDKGDPK